MSGTEAVRVVLSVSLFEPPLVIPGFDKIVLKLLLIGTAIMVTGGAVIIGSIVGIIRAVHRTRRGGRSIAAVVLAVIATAIAASWLFYWVGDALYHRENPINGFVAINFGICTLPMSWLIAAINANVARRKE